MPCHCDPARDAAEQRLCLECHTHRTALCDICGWRTWWRDLTERDERRVCDPCMNLLGIHRGAGVTSEQEAEKDEPK